MKIIKSFLIVATALGTSTMLYAQQEQIKAETAKPAASTVPPPGSKPALAPDMKPEVKNVQLQKSEAAVPATPSPLTREENMKAPQEKPTLKLINEKEVNTTPSLSADNLKTLNGTAEKPKQAAPASNEQNTKPLPIASPVVLKVQQNQ